MVNRFLVLTLLIICPATSFAWDGDGYWGYHGSGRDYSYSQYIDDRYTIGYADYSRLGPDYYDQAVYSGDVSAPPVIVPVVAPAPNEFTVNIPNDHGGYNAVVIKRSGNGFVGPQGEFYPQFPTVYQLKVIYGKNGTH